MTKYGVWYGARSFVGHTLHAYVMDAINLLLGRSPRYVSPLTHLQLPKDDNIKSFYTFKPSVID